jgi:4-hydroxy-tetrahydrodipicolinate reductase
VNGRAPRLLIVGYGKMGRLVDQLATEQGFAVAGRVDQDRPEWADADVAVDFSTAEALLRNFDEYVQRRLAVVIGTTGWSEHGEALRGAAQRAGLGVVASANFSIGVNVFQLVVAEAARLLQDQEQYGAWIHEAHHAAKRDAPSGTALLLRDAMAGAGFGRSIDMSSTRAGMIPGTHTVGFDAASDTIELTHTARDRRGFAAGALLAARWIGRRQGWYSMQDVLKDR